MGADDALAALVDALAARWEVVDRDPQPGKTVRAEVDVPGWPSLVRAHPV
ncbi:hypothetical protein ACFSL4_23520 [Streptomyces caeni]|uniref:Uncharacterized protein n=1 Tax=Streptomyces caeni TaxID=2307231 RepID=A0ABW4IYN8_9ACTN